MFYENTVYSVTHPIQTAKAMFDPKQIVLRTIDPLGIGRNFYRIGTSIHNNDPYALGKFAGGKAGEVTFVLITNGVAKRVGKAKTAIKSKGVKRRKIVKYDLQKFSKNIKITFKSIKNAPNYPKGFKAKLSGTTLNKVKNGKVLNELRKIEGGDWKKVYKDGYNAAGKKISIHYFQSKSGKVFDVKVKQGWSN